MSKYNAKKTEYNGIVFDSAVECDYYKHLENKMNGVYYNRIELQPRYELILSLVNNARQNTSQTLPYT